MIGLFLLANLVIVAGYGLVAVGVAPHFKSATPVTRVGGVLFFMLCAATHLEFVAHWATGSGISLEEFGSVHMALIHVPQAIAVLWFISGLYIDQRVSVAGSPGLVVGTDRLLRFVAYNRASVWLATWIERRLYGTAFALAVAIGIAGTIELML